VPDGDGPASRASGVAAPDPPRSAFAPLRHRNFRLLWTGMLISQTGSWMQFVAQGYLVDQLTKAPIYLGLLGIAQAIPRFLFALIGGVAADRLDRRRVLLITNALLMSSAWLLWWLTYTQRIQIWHILALASFNSVTSSFDVPTRQSIISNLVGDRELMPALSLQSMANNGSGVWGPSIGGVVIAAIGVVGCFFVNATTYIAVFVALLLMEIPRHANTARVSLGHDLREGFGLLARHRHLLVLLAIVAVLSFFGRPYVRMMPAVAREVLHVGPQGLGILQAAPSAGTVLAVFVLNAISGSMSKGRIMLVAGTIAGSMVTLFGLSRSFTLSIALLVLTGIGQSLAFAAANTLVQTTVLPEQRGRMMGLYNMLAFGMFALGTLPVGALAHAVGVGYALSIGGLIVVAFMTTVALTSQRVRAL
jgi:MFS family permease